MGRSDPLQSGSGGQRDYVQQSGLASGRPEPDRPDAVCYPGHLCRRMIGHKYYPFINYTMPEHVYKDADPRLKRLLGFLDRGAYR